MYNEELKLRFITKPSGVPKRDWSIFDKIEPFEVKYGTDLCQFDRDMMQDLFDNSFGANHSTLRAIQTFIRRYCVWCQEQGLEVKFSVNDINIDPKDKYRIGMVGSPKMLESYLNRRFNNVYNENFDTLGRCYVWCAYMGIPEKLVPTITVNDVDFRKREIHLDNKTYYLYKESIPAFKNACNLTYFLYQHPNYTKPIKRERFDNEYVFRGIKSPVLTTYALRDTISKLFNAHSDFKIRYQHIFMSGIFDRMYRAELKRIKPDLHSIAVDLYDGKSTDQSRINSNLVRKRKALQDDYEGWKRVFHPEYYF